MARRYTCGFEMPYYTNALSLIDASRSEDNNSLTPGRCGGYAFSIDHAASYRYEHDITSIDSVTFGSLIEPSYTRFYMRIRAYPNAGGSPVGTTIWNATGDADFAKPAATGMPSVYGVLLSNGTMSFYSKGQGSVAPATNLLGSITTPLSLNVWYRVNIFLQFNTIADTTDPQNSNALMTVQIAEAGSALPGLPGDGTRAFTFNGASPQQFAFGINDETNQGRVFSIGLSATATGSNGGVIDIDDWVMDDASAPDEGFITLHRPIAAGTYSEWTTNGFRQARALPDGSDTALSSSGASARLSFVVESLASKGVTGTIRSVRVAGSVEGPRDAWKFGLRQNGTDNYNPAAVTGNRLPVGWLIDSGVLSISPTDDLEVIVRDGTGAGTNATLEFMCLVVEVEQAAYAPLAVTSSAIQVYEGTFTGSGAPQDVSVPFATPAEPDFILVKPDNNGGAGGWWHRGLGNRGDGSISCVDADRGPISWVEANAFTVRSVEGVNDSGETNRFIAVSDPSRRMNNIARFSTNVLSVDGRDISFNDSGFLPEAVFVTAREAGADHAHFRGPGYAGDLTSQLDGNLAAVANMVQSITTGSINIGTGLQENNLPYGVYVLRTLDVFDTNVLCEIGTYTGNGVATRVIPLTLTGSSGAGFVMVVPHNTEPRCCRFGSQVGTGNYQWASATLNTTSGITAFSVSSFTVATGTSDLNASGVVYDYVVFGVGSDTVTDLAVTGTIDSIEPASATRAFGWLLSLLTGELCDDCGCRMAEVPREIRVARVPSEGRRVKDVPIDPRVKVVLLDARTEDILPENRTVDIDCA